MDPTNDTPVVTAASTANTFTEREGPSDTSVAFGTNAIVVDGGTFSLQTVTILRKGIL